MKKLILALLSFNILTASAATDINDEIRKIRELLEWESPYDENWQKSKLYLEGYLHGLEYSIYKIITEDQG